jgi:quercetin dioxygenase-like cupin family protein
MKEIADKLRAYHLANRMTLRELEKKAGCPDAYLNFRRGDAKIQMLVRDIRNRRMQPFYTTIEPGGGSEGSYSHMGEEFGIVLKGMLELRIQGRTHRVRKNESFYSSSHEPHCWSNLSKSMTVVI